MKITVQTTDELLAVVPHVLGFEPHDSLVVLPSDTSQRVPTMRVDLPRSERDATETGEALRRAVERHAAEQGGGTVTVIAFTDDPQAAEMATGVIARHLGRAGLTTIGRVFTDGEVWAEFLSGNAGQRTDEARTRFAATAVAAGAAAPAASREERMAALVGDRGPVAAVLPQIRERADRSSPEAELEWATDRVERFLDDGHRFDDHDAARLLVAIESTSLRDVLWLGMGKETNAESHLALWSDLTARAPDEVRTPAATLAAFSCWLTGDGSRAWGALDQIPARGASYTMAHLVRAALENSIDPRDWSRMKMAAVDQAFSPEPGRRAPRPPAPGQGRGPDRGPAR